MIILLSFVMCFRSIGRFYVNNVYICTSITNIVYMSDRQQFIIDCTSLIPVIGTLVLIQLYGVIEHQLQVWIGRLVIQVIKWTDD